MSKTVIRVNKLGKRYRIGTKREELGNIREAVIGMVKAPIKNFRRLRKLTNFQDGNFKETDDIIWALKGVSFEVKEGEAVGIIGRNGAGKSTLLKILTRITEPTEGCAEIKGRVSSLLEVGTGFHPELTGRENIYLNGSILGMRKWEIDKKFDEIVAFAEVEKFINTPVKRYSSGMKVRLAFAVAAHLEPEILLVDEVLAVGDAAFQKKCIGKMNEVAKEGRTVLFVSHNMGAIQNLCPRSILLSGGRIKNDAETGKTIKIYLESMQNKANCNLIERKDRKGKGQIKTSMIQILDERYKPIEYAVSGKKIIVRLYYKTTTNVEFRNCRVSISIHSYGNVYFLASTELVRRDELILSGEKYLDCIIENFPLSKGEYYVTSFIETNKIIQDWVEAAYKLSVIDGNFYGCGRDYPLGWEGKTVLVEHRWEW